MADELLLVDEDVPAFLDEALPEELLLLTPAPSADEDDAPRDEEETADLLPALPPTLLLPDVRDEPVVLVPLGACVLLTVLLLPETTPVLEVDGVVLLDVLTEDPRSVALRLP